MSGEASAEETAAALRNAISLLFRRMRQVPPEQARDELSLSERAALARLEYHGPTTAADLARLEQIRPQSMGATLAELEAAALVARRPDLADGRRVLMHITATGRRRLTERRTARMRQMAATLSADFTRDELATLAKAAPLLERLGRRL